MNTKYQVVYLAASNLQAAIYLTDLQDRVENARF